ncbi:MAG: Superoxide dismutase [Myxococcaceae bacterium]|nr:Superoxide dismutase [Myxococcaceae bacterium]
MEDNSRSGSSRRRFIGSALAASASVLVAKQAFAQVAKPADAGTAAPAPAAAVPAASHPSLALPPLPYPQAALEPYISGTTLSFHYGKHHKAYFDKLNTLIESTPYKGKSLEDIVKGSAKNKKDQKIFNNAAQAWNHSFYWTSMKPKGGGAPPAELAARIDKDFGSYEAFKSQFVQTGVDHFSNGWVWLVLDKGKLKLIDTHDADTPVVHGLKPLLVSDIWEHAYYLDYKNARKDYLTAYVDHLLNWDFIAANLA